MAIRTAGRIAGTTRVAERERVAWPATIPAHTVIGIYHGMLDGVGTAAELRRESPQSQVWVATGKTGAELVQAAWDSRSLLGRIGGALGDEALLIESLVRAANGGHTLVAAAGNPDIARFDGASEVVRVGRWTFGRVK